MEDYSQPEMQTILSNEDNKTCFDCGSPNPTWASLNNGVVICAKCANLHRTLRTQASITRSLLNESWNQKQILTMNRGGNERLKKFLQEYQVPINAPIDYKYMIRACDYYRTQLKAEVDMGLSSTIIIPFSALRNRPDLISGLEMLEYEETDNEEIPMPVIIETNANQGFLDSVGDFFNQAKEKVKDTSKKVVEKVREMELDEKIKATGEKTFDYAKASGTFIAQKGKDLYQSEFVKKVAHKAEEGITVIVDKTKTLLKKEEQNELLCKESDVVIVENLEDQSKYNSKNK